MTAIDNKKPTVPIAREGTVTKIFIQRKAPGPKRHEGSRPVVVTGGDHHVQATTVVMGVRTRNTPMVAAVSTVNARIQDSRGPVEARDGRVELNLIFARNSMVIGAVP